MTTLPQHGNGNHDGQADTMERLDIRIPTHDTEVKPADPTDLNDSKSSPRRKRRRRFTVLWATLIAVCIGTSVYYVREMMPFETTDDASIEGHVIAISPQVSAQVVAVHIDDNQFVHKGDLLVGLDPTNFVVALRQAQGAEASARGKLEQARASVGTAQSAIIQARATVDSSEATLLNANITLNRYQSLSPEARSQQDLDNATANHKTTAAAVELAKAQLDQAQSQLTSARANVAAAEGDYQKAQADTQNAQVNLSYCRIFAPDDGRITNKSVEHGAYVTPATTLFQIVPPKVWVTANFKETQLTHMRPGQSVKVSIDAYPDLDLRGTVNSIQAGTGSRFSIIPAENATGNFVKVVQRVPVKITLQTNGDNSEQFLSPGMSVEPSVRVR